MYVSIFEHGTYGLGVTNHHKGGMGGTNHAAPTRTKDPGRRAATKTRLYLGILIVWYQLADEACVQYQ